MTYLLVHCIGLGLHNNKPSLACQQRQRRQSKGKEGKEKPCSAEALILNFGNYSTYLISTFKAKADRNKDF
jgi:hypothetical protein